jgi:hypothetical protein
MEIIGRRRKNKNIKATNSPMVPINVAQSQTVGEYRFHEDGTPMAWAKCGCSRYCPSGMEIASQIFPSPETGTNFQRPISMQKRAER